MRRHFLLSFILLAATAALAAAQEPVVEPQGIPILEMPAGGIIGEWHPLTLEEVPSPFGPDNIPAGGDSCATATTITVPANAETGSQMTTLQMSSNEDDPSLAGCMWGFPARLQGYRSVWYRFTAPATGWLRVSTEGSDYDTVVAVFGGTECGALSLASCNDDHIGFTSLATAWVDQGQSYFIVVVSWHLAANGYFLRLTAGIESVSQRTTVGTMPAHGIRTRHIAVTYGDYIYVIGGLRYDGDGLPQRTQRTDRYNTLTGEWERMDNMPYTCGSDGPGVPDEGGYANTTGVVLGDRIYVPAGYVGDATIYQGNHCVFDLTVNRWFPHPYHDPNFFPANAPWPAGQPFAYSAAVAYPPQNGYFLTGGLTGRAVPLSPGQQHGQPRHELFFYSAPGNSWETLAPMPTGRYAHAAALQQIGGRDYICVVGGIGAAGDGAPLVLSNGECYDIAAGAWNLTVGPLNVPRYNHGSAVRDDGRWFIFGGTEAGTLGAAGESVALTEMYDPASNSWIALDSRYDVTEPARSWPRGGFIGPYLWITGGHMNTATGERVVNLVENLFLPFNQFFPAIVAGGQAANQRPGHNLETAAPIEFQQPQFHGFIDPKDYIHFYYFDIAEPTPVATSLRQIPGGSNYDLHIYNENKGRLVTGGNLGNLDEIVGVEIIPGRYYVIVERVFPPRGAEPNPAAYRVETWRP
jgi:hypothetical protein